LSEVFVKIRCCCKEDFSLGAAGPLFLGCPSVSLSDEDMVAHNADNVFSREHLVVDDEDLATLERLRVIKVILEAASAIRLQALTLHLRWQSPEH
jgi:hypothetical protein